MEIGHLIQLKFRGRKGSRDHYGPGKGFGNSIVSNEIRTGLSSRDDIEKFNQTIESKIDGPRDILFKNYQNPNNLILPFPRFLFHWKLIEHFLSERP